MKILARRLSLATLAATLVSPVVAATAFDDPPASIPATPLLAPGQPAQPAKDAAKPSPKTKLYDETADGKKQIEDAIAKAKKENQRVLIQWGGNWCGWCIRLHELCKSNPKIARELMYEYVVVHVDCGKPIGKNIALAKSYGADVEKHGFPYLTVLDSSGKPIANQETEALEVKNAEGKSAGVKEGHDPEKVLTFLKSNKAPYENAQVRFDKALMQAKAQNKAVFLHFGAPWCVYCHKLENWMAIPTVASLLEKDFIDCKIDEDRNIDGKELEVSFSKGKHGGIPYFVFVKADGTAIIDSIASQGNIGFPSDPGEIEHFKKMLSTATRNLSPSEVIWLADSLKPEGMNKDGKR